MRRFIKQTLWWLIAVLVFAASMWIMMPVYRLGFAKFQGDNTVNAVAQWVRICGLVFLFGVIWSIKTNQPQQQGDSPAKKSTGLWKFVLFSTSMILISIAIFNISVDPWDIYGINFFESRVIRDRTEKLTYYSLLTAPPDMVIVGSSAAFEIAPSYIKEKVGLTAFNWSMSAGKNEEISVLLKYLAKQHGGEFPEIVLMQLVESPPLKDPYSLLPLPLFPYLDYLPLIEEVGLRLSKAIDLSQFSDAYYVVRYRLSSYTRSFTNIYFLEDGSGARIQKNFSDAEVLKQSNKIPDCKSVEEIFGTEIESIVAFSKEQDSSIIFYISPILPDFYDSYMRDNPDYQRCHQMVTSYFTELAMENDDMFFKDYSLLESVNGVDGEEGFYDGAHLTQQNANRLIDALSDTILQAYEVAEGKRTTGGGGSE